MNALASSHSAAEALGALALFGGLAAVIAVAIWQLSATRRARLVATRAEEYKHLAEQATRAEESAQVRLADLTKRLDAMHERVEAIEAILAEVE